MKDIVFYKAYCYDENSNVELRYYETIEAAKHDSYNDMKSVKIFLSKITLQYDGTGKINRSETHVDMNLVSGRNMQTFEPVSKIK